MDGNVLAKRIASHAVSEKATKFPIFFWVQSGLSSQPGSGPTFE